MTRPGWFEQNPRLESLDHAHLREQAEARERRCTTCGAPPMVECTNAQTGKPFRGGVSHLARVRPE